MSSLPAVSIAVTRYAEPDWLVLQTLESLSIQRGVSAEILFLDQSPNDSVVAQFTAMGSPNIRCEYVPIPAKSLSFARNAAVRRASAEAILFIDSDAVAQPGWAVAIATCLADGGVGVVGTRILPRWQGRPPLIARSRMVRDQYSIFDHGECRRSVPRVVGASFGLHRKRLGAEAYFEESLGRREGALLGGEESDLCQRVLRSGLNVVYEGRAAVHHQIHAERMCYRWILKRFFYAGLTRARLGGPPRPSHPLRLWDFVALPIVLPSYVTGYLYGKHFRQRAAL